MFIEFAKSLIRISDIRTVAQAQNRQDNTYLINLVLYFEVDKFCYPMTETFDSMRAMMERFHDIKYELNNSCDPCKKRNS